MNNLFLADLINKLTKDEQEKIKHLHPVFAKMLAETLLQARDEKLNVYLFQGLRTFEEQDKLFAKGRNEKGEIVDKRKVVTYVKGGHSWHNYGLAGDIVFKDKNNRWSWRLSHNWQLLGEIGKDNGLTWGGDFRSFKDRPHFQYTGGLNIIEALIKYEKGGLEKVWMAVI